jgi:hypothetical protein
MAKEKPIIQQIKERKWKWMGTPWRKDSQVIQRQVLKFIPQRQHNRGRPLRGHRGKQWKKIFEKWERPGKNMEP